MPLDKNTIFKWKINYHDIYEYIPWHFQVTNTRLHVFLFLRHCI